MGLFGDYNPGESDDAMFGGQTRAQNAESAEQIAWQNQRDRELSNQRLSAATTRLDPWSGMESEALSAYMGELGLGPETGRGLAYMNSAGYQSQLDEALDTVGQNSISSGATAYGGRRLKDAGRAGASIQDQYQRNYMNMLSSTASPTTSTNISSLSLDQAAGMGSQGNAAYNSIAANSAAANSAAQAQANDTGAAALSLIGMVL